MINKLFEQLTINPKVKREHWSYALTDIRELLEEIRSYPLAGLNISGQMNDEQELINARAKLVLNILRLQYRQNQFIQGLDWVKHWYERPEMALKALAAIKREVGEALDETNYAWWKPGKLTDISNYLSNYFMEIVDILHFTATLDLGITFSSILTLKIDELSKIVFPDVLAPWYFVTNTLVRYDLADLLGLKQELYDWLLEINRLNSELGYPDESSLAYQAPSSLTDEEQSQSQTIVKTSMRVFSPHDDETEDDRLIKQVDSIGRYVLLAASYNREPIQLKPNNAYSLLVALDSAITDYEFYQEVLFETDRAYLSTSLIADILNVYNVDVNKLFTIYVAKMLLNIFRQYQGYSNKQYRKQWDFCPSETEDDKKEDNYCLLAVLRELLSNPQATFEDLFRALSSLFELYHKYVNV